MQSIAHPEGQDTPQDANTAARDLRVSGLITLSVAPGLALFGVAMGFGVDARLFSIFFGASMLVGYVGAGLLAAAYVVKKWHPEQTCSRCGNRS